MKRLVILSLSLGLLVAVLLSGGVDAKSSAERPGWAESNLAPAEPTPTPGRTVSITNFQISATPGGQPATWFPPGTTILFVEFSYTTALNDRVGVMIRDEFGYVLLEHEANYYGAGRVNLVLTGQAAYQAYWQATGPAGDSLLLAISVTQGSASLSELRQRLAGTLALAYQYQGLLTQIQRYPLDPPAAAALNQALAALDRAIAKGRQGLTPGLTEAEIRALLDQMAVETATAVNETARAKSLAGDGVGFALLDTVDAETSVANVFANGNLVQTIEWQVGALEPTFTPTPGPGTPTSTPEPTYTPTASPTPTATPTPETVQVEIEASPGRAGYVDSRYRTRNFLGAAHMYTGADARLPIDTIYHGIFQFDLSGLPAGAEIVAAQVELTGLDDQFLGDDFWNGSGGTWRLNLLAPAVDGGWSQLSYWQIHNAPVDAVLSPVLTDEDLAPGQANMFTLGPSQLSALEARVVGSGKASFRLDGSAYSPDARHIFDWDPGLGQPGGHGPVLRVTYRQPAMLYYYGTP